MGADRHCSRRDFLRILAVWTDDHCPGRQCHQDHRDHLGIKVCHFGNVGKNEFAISRDGIIVTWRCGINQLSEMVKQNGQTHSNNSSTICRRIECDHFVKLALKGLICESLSCHKTTHTLTINRLPQGSLKISTND